MRLFILLAAAFAMPSATIAQVPATQPATVQTAPPPFPMKPDGQWIIIGESFKLQSRVLGGSRTINVRLPGHYGLPGSRPTVLVLLDGGEREDFLHIAGLAQITSAWGEGRELIVVGVEGVDRRHDLTSPSSVASDLKAAPTSGGSAAYRRFLVDELKPWIDAHYPLHGSYAIIGESLAGLFVLETLLEEPTAFDDYISVSPSLWWNGGRMSLTAADRVRRVTPAGRRLWIGFDRPSPPADQAARERALQDGLVAALRSSAPAGLAWSAEHLDEGHSTVYHPAALRALRALYAIGGQGTR